MEEVNVKICGLRRKLDINYINRYKPEYAGFVFAKGKRQVTPDSAKELVEDLAPGIKAVGVFVNESPDKLVEIVKKCNLNIVQLHGDEILEYIELVKRKLLFLACPGVEIWKAIKISSHYSYEKMLKYYQHKVDAIVLDTYSKNAPGGTGEAFDWNLAADAGKNYKVVLAGGLNSENIIKAAGIIKPFAVDISSGVETAGWKDEEKIGTLISIVRAERKG